LLALVGIYGVVAYSVAQQRANIGIRMAVGATPREISRSFVIEALKLSSIGIAVGLCLAMVANRLMAAALVGIGGFDAVTFAVVAVLFCTVTVAASLIPAWRASRVEPMSVLRYE
jgi:ABC-type antimicrobial peptide transport system permease subunit